VPENNVGGASDMNEEIWHKKWQRNIFLGPRKKIFARTNDFARTME
jgi:hypothetical protein